MPESVPSRGTEFNAAMRAWTPTQSITGFQPVPRSGTGGPPVSRVITTLNGTPFNQHERSDLVLVRRVRFSGRNPGGTGGPPVSRVITTLNGTPFNQPERSDLVLPRRVASADGTQVARASRP